MKWLKKLYDKRFKKPIEWIEIKVPSSLKHPIKAMKRDKKKEEEE